MLNRFVPLRIKDAIKVLCGTARAVPNVEQESAKFCPVCRRPTKFQPLPYYYARQLAKFGFANTLFDFETLNLEEYSCRNCEASDRERLFALYFDRVWQGPGTILEIAPRPAFTEYLKGLSQASVRTADLFDPAADDQVDLTDMAIYTSRQFDVWVCSHVLEHVPDDRQAMSELFRVLKPGGWGIVMVPICLPVKNTLEDPTITDPSMRWKCFGQDDHIRLYAKNDFIQRLESAGFEMVQIDSAFFGAEQCHRAGIDMKSVVYIAKKKSDAM